MPNDKIDIDVTVRSVTFYTYEEFTKQRAHLLGTSFLVISNPHMTTHHLLRANAEVPKLSGHELIFVQLQSLDKSFIRLAVRPDTTQISVLGAVTAEGIPLEDWIRTMESDQSIINNEAIISGFANGFNAAYAKLHGHPPTGGFSCRISIPRAELRQEEQIQQNFFNSLISFRAKITPTKEKRSLMKDDTYDSKIHRRKWCCCLY